MFNEESFIEEQITEKHVDIKNKKISIILNGGCLNNGDHLEKVNIIIEDWHSLKIIQKNNEDTKELSINYACFFSSILKFNYINNNLSLSDVGNNCWLEWFFINPKVTIYGE